MTLWKEGSGDFDKNQLKQIRGQKASYKILSLSETPNNMLMWSYYSEGHKGFVVGVEVIDSDTDVDPVIYVDSLHVDKTSNDLAKSILTKKLSLWEHEKEHRAFKRNSPFIKVRIKELLFGLHTDDRQKKILSKVAERFCPDIQLKTISRDILETGKVDEI